MGGVFAAFPPGHLLVSGKNHPNPLCGHGAHPAESPVRRCGTLWICGDSQQRQDSSSAPVGMADSWVIGGEALRENKSLGTGIRILDIAAPDQNTLLVQVNKTYNASQFQVDMPGDDIAARLLRNPFHLPSLGFSKSKFKIDPEAGISFSRNGRKIAVGIESGIMVYPIPNSPAMKIGKPRYFRPRKTSESSVSKSSRSGSWL